MSITGTMDRAIKDTRAFAEKHSKDEPMTARALAEELRVTPSTARYYIALARLKRSEVREGARGPMSVGWYL